MNRKSVILCIALLLLAVIFPCRLKAATEEELRQFDSLNKKYNADRDAGRFEDAEADARQMLAMSQTVFPDRPPLRAASLTYLALAYVGEGRYSQAEKLAIEALRAWENTTTPDRNSTVASALNHLANIYARQARYQEAEPYYKRALELQMKQAGPNDSDVASFICNLALLYETEGKYDAAEPLFKRALAIRERALGPEHVDVAASLLNLGALYNTQGKNADAEILYQRALAIQRKKLGSVHPDVALTLNNLANVYADRSQYAQAAAMHDESLAIREKLLGPKHPDVAVSLGNLAGLHYRFGRYAKAQELNDRALAIMRESLGPDHPLLAEALDVRASVYDAQGKTAEAIESYQLSLAIREKALGANHPNVAATCNNLGNLYLDQGDYRQAKPLFDRTIQILAGRQLLLDLYVKCYRQRAIARWHLDDRAGALDDLRSALKTLEEQRGLGGGTEKERADFLEDYSFAFEEMLEWQLQLGHFDEAFAAAEQLRARTLIDQLNLQGADLLSGLSAAEAKRLKDRDTAARAMVASLEQQMDLLPDRRDFDDSQKKTEESRLLGRLEAARQEQIDAYRAIRNASPAYQSMVTHDFKPVELAALADWVKHQHALLLQYFLGDEGGYLFVLAPERAPQIVKLEISKEQLSDFGAADSPETSAKHRHGGDRNIPNEQLNAGPLTADRLQLAMLIDGQDVVQRLSNAEKDDALTARLATLWKLLIPAEVRGELLAGKYDRLMVIPDGALVNLPFESLVVETGENPEYLLDRGPPILECPSATLLYNLAHREQAAKNGNGKPGVLSLGNPNYQSSKLAGGAAPNSDARSGSTDVFTNFKPAARYASRGISQPLPNTGTEVSWVSEAFTKNGLAATKLLRADATEANLRSRIAGQEIVHLACHGLVDAEQGNFFGALALTPGAKAGTNPADDGFLTLPEIYELNLKGCELSILSACQTNFGPQERGEGVWALSRGFLVAGSRRVVASNWLVDDEAAASLIYFFCSSVAQQETAEGGRGKTEIEQAKQKSTSKSGSDPTVDYAKALRDAKRAIRRQAKWQHPYYWATFTLIGPG